MNFSRSRAYRSARSFYFGQFVTDYERAYSRPPSFQECRIFFTYASRKAYPYGIA